MSNSETKFKVEKQAKEQYTLLLISGYLDAHTAPELESSIETCITNNSYNIIVEFSELDYISSAGLGVFMAFIEDIRNNNGDLKMVAMKDKVFNVFDLLGFPMLFDIDKSVDEAVEKFKLGLIKNNE
jgi:anti-sigma B factor antagonist